MLSLWSPPLAHLDSLPPWSGTLDKRIFSFWQRRLRRSCQLLSLWHWGHSFLFGRPSMFKFFRWSLRHSARSSLVSATPTSLPFLFSSTIWFVLFSPLYPLLHLSSHLKLCGRSGRNCLLSLPVLSDYNGSPYPRFYRGTTRLMRWLDRERYLRPPQSLVVFLLSSYPLLSFFGLEAYCLIKILWHTGSLDFQRGTCALSSCSLCSLSSSLQRTQPSFRLLSLQDWQNREFFLQRLRTFVPGHFSFHSALSS